MQQHGHEVQIINTLRCYMSMASLKPEIHYRGRVLEGYDAVIPRIGASITFYGTAVLRQFEMMGVFPINESVAITRSRDKLRSLQLLARKGIGMPVTGFANAPDDIPDLVNMTIGRTFGSRVYDRFYSRFPRLFGGCRGVQLAEILERNRFRVRTREYIQQCLFPSEVILAHKTN